MSCVAPNSAAPLMAARRGVTAQEEKKRPHQDNRKKPKRAKFHRNHFCLCERKAIKELQRENGARIIRHLGSGIVSGFKRTRPPERSESLSRCLDSSATVGPSLFRVTSRPILRITSVNGQK